MTIRTQPNDAEHCQDAKPRIIRNTDETDSLCIVEVRADDEDGHYRWQCKLGLDMPLQKLGEAWAQDHAVPLKIVGFENGEDEEQEEKLEYHLNDSPSTLGWKADSVHIIIAFPKDEEHSYMEVVPTSAATPAKDHCAEATAAANSASNGKVGDFAAAAQAAAGQGPAAVEPSQAAGNASATPAKRGPPIKREAPVKSEASATPIKQEARAKGAVKRELAEASSSKSKAVKKEIVKKEKDEGDKKEAIGLDEPIEFVQPNPKRPGGSSHARYTGYMKAKTIREAMDKCGAWKGDIINDTKLGYLKRRSG